MKHFIIAIIIANSWCFSQEVLVFDTQKNPISGVAAFNKEKTKSALSSRDGVINLSRFLDSETVFFQHPSYILKDSKKSDINNFITLEINYNILDEIELKETKNTNNIKNIAEKKIYISSREITELGSGTTADILEKKGGVSVQKSQMGGGSPNIRGFEANKVLLVLDGVRLNNAIYRSGHLQNIMTIDEYMLEDIEIVFGPSSVLYGSDALGGTIHMKTKSVYFKPNQEWGGGVFSSYHSAYSSLKSNFFTTFESNKYSMITSFSAKKFGDLRMGAFREHGYQNWGLVYHYIDNEDNIRCNPNLNIQPGVGYSQYDFFNKSIFKLSPSWRVTSNIQYSTSSNIPRLDKLNDNDMGCLVDSNGVCSSGENLKYHSYYYGPQERVFASLKFTGLNYYFDKSEIIIGHQFVKESRHTWKLDDFLDYLQYPNTPENYEPRTNKYESVKVYSLNTDFRKQNFYFGSETIYNDVFSRGIDSGDDAWSIENTRYPPGGSSLFSHAVYAHRLERVSHKLQFELGARYTYSNIQGSYPDTMERPVAGVEGLNLSTKNHIVSGNFKFVYYPSDSWKISGVTSRGFHAPNIDDMLKVFQKGDNITIPNINLEPEYAMSQEISISKSFKEKFNLYAVGFYTKIKNAIVKDSISMNMNPDPNGPPFMYNMIQYDDEFLYTFANQNAKNDTDIYGFTLGFNGIFRGVKINGDFNLTRGVNYSLNAGPVSHIPPIFGKVELLKEWQNYTIRLLYLYSGYKSSNSFDDSGTDNLEETPLLGAENDGTLIYAGLPSWHILNISIKYELTKYIQMQLAVENIFDNHYKTFGSGLSAPGRNFILSTNILF